MLRFARLQVALWRRSVIDLAPDACITVLKDDDMPISCAPDERASSCRPIPGSVLDVVLSQQLLPGCRRLNERGLLWETAVRKLPAVLEERKVATSVLQTFDKAFACTWLGGPTAVFGTKDDKLVLLDVDTLRVQKVVTLPPSSQPDTRDPLAIPVQCGIRCLERNPGGDLLVAAGCGPNDAAILSLPDCQPLLRLQGHRDWVFGATWVTDRLLVTGSRDKSVKLWDVSVDPGCEPVAGKPLASKQHPTTHGNRGKVRGVKWCAAKEEAASVSTDAVLCLWSADLQLRRTVQLPESDEISCLASDGEQLYAIGTSAAAHIIDPRARRPAVDRCTSLQHYQGNRSLQFRHGLLSVGSGASEVWFYDLRAGAYLPPAEAPMGARRKRATMDFEVRLEKIRAPRLCMSKGWLDHNETYWEYFENMEVHNAAYAHEWDPGGSRMLVVGGPLASGLTGSYVALWQ